MQCQVCGKYNPTHLHACQRCGAPFAASALAQAPTTPALTLNPLRQQRRIPALVFSLLLASLLVLVGVAGVRAASNFSAALRPPTAADLAARVCTALTTQQYGLLTGSMDPTPVPTIAPGPYSAATLAAQLRGLDARSGPVKSCAYKPLVLAPTARTTATAGATATAAPPAIAQFALTVQRTRAKTPSSLLLTMRESRSGQWLLSRASNLLS